MSGRRVSNIPTLPLARCARLGAAAAVVLVGSLARGFAQGPPPPDTVPYVDLDRYVGTWYEIAHIPNRFQKHCRGDTRARYHRLPEGTIGVINSCLGHDGRVDEAHGIARLVEPLSNAKLEVSFVSLFGWHLFWGDYWILDLAPDYSYAVVGTPDRRFGWILGRKPILPAATRQRIDTGLRRAGYDPAVFVNTAQGIRPAGDSRDRNPADA